MGCRGGPAAAVSTNAAGPVEFFEVRGYYIELPEKDAAGTFIRPIFTEAQLAKLQPLVPANATPFWGNNTVTSATLLGTIVLASFQNWPAFSPDPTQTKYTSLPVKSATVMNLMGFTIQVKLAKPIAIQH